MHQMLADREAHLKADLQRCNEEGCRSLAERSALAKDLHNRSARVAAMSDKEVALLRNDIKVYLLPVTKAI